MKATITVRKGKMLPLPLEAMELLAEDQSRQRLVRAMRELGEFKRWAVIQLRLDHEWARNVVYPKMEELRRIKERKA